MLTDRVITGDTYCGGNSTGRKGGRGGETETDVIDKVLFEPSDILLLCRQNVVSDRANEYRIKLHEVLATIEFFRLVADGRFRARSSTLFAAARTDSNAAHCQVLGVRR